MTLVILPYQFYTISDQRIDTSINSYIINYQIKGESKKGPYCFFIP